MKNTLKLTTDKTEYVCTTDTQLISVTNLDSLGASDIFLSPNSIEKYPIKILNGKNITIDTLNIDNNTSKMFRVYAKYTLPELEIVDMPSKIQQNTTYQVKIMKKNWFSTSLNKYNLEFGVYIGEDEELYFTKGMMYFDVVGETNDYWLYEFSIQNSQIPPGEHLISFKMIYSVDSQNKNYLCETKPKIFEITPCIQGSNHHEAIYLERSEFLFERNQKYTLRLKSDVILTNSIVRIHFNTNPSVDIYADVINDNTVEFLMPELSLTSGNSSTFTVQAHAKATDSTPDLSSHIACSTTYNFLYYKL